MTSPRKRTPRKRRSSPRKSSPRKSPSNYTKPALRARIVEEVKAGSKGGRPGQWSARKAQLVAQRYKAEGGGYRGKKTSPQKSLEKWTGEKWRTSDGSPSKGRKRYLPDKAWNELSEQEKRATNRKKAEGFKQGKQFVPNTPKAKEAGRRARN